MIKKIFLLLGLFIFWSTAGAFGLGGMKVDSALNEPLNARVTLISVQPEEIDNIKVRLAGPDVFARAGIPRPFFLSKLRFRLMAPEDGEPYIRVTTRESVREPYLNFLLEVVWSRGNMVREFTILLDPPAYTPPKLARTEARGSAPAETTSAPAPSTRSSAAPTATSYGPIKSTDTLWVIAGKVQADPSVSRNQTMMALLKANPDAFVNGNINQLKRGVVLTVPSLDQVKAITRSQANALVKQQMAEWRQGRAAAKTASRSRPEKSAAPEQAPVAEPEVPATASTEPAPAEEVEARAASSETGETGPEEGQEETDKKQLRVLDADGNWVVSDQSDKRYPARESDKIREAIRDSEQELVAVQAINQDILELRAALESKVEALKKALEEKDAQLESLRKQIEQADEKASAAVQDSAPDVPPSAPQSTATTPQAPVTQQAKAPAGNLAASTVVGEPKALSSYWKDEYWMILMGVVIVILSILLLLSMRRRDRVHQLATPELFQVSSEELDAEPPFAAADVDVSPIPDTTGGAAQTMRAVTPQQDAVPEDERNDRRQEGDIASVLTEADIYLAYRRYSQAESLVEEAMQNNPESPELKAKLLEIYAFRRDASSFSRYLDQIYPSLMVQSPDLWEKVVEMGRELVPEHPAFNGGGSGAQGSVDEEIVSTVQADDDESLPDDLFDIDLDLPEEQRQELPSADDESISIEELMDDRPLPDHHEIPSIEIDLDEDDLNLDFDDENEKPRRKDDE